MQIFVEKIEPNPQQPRKLFDQVELQELADSIKTNGLLQSIVVEKHDDKYILVAGERRLRAHKLLGLDLIEAQIKEPSNHNGRELLISAIVENVQRVDMNPIDEAVAYQRLHDEYNLTYKKIGQMLGKNCTLIHNAVKLLDYDKEIIEKVKAKVFPKNVSLAHAIQKVPDKNARMSIAAAVENHKITVKNAIKTANKIAKAFVEAECFKNAKSPALELSKRKTDLEELGEDYLPKSWNIFQATGKLPDWPMIIKSAENTCKACLMRPMASEEVCNECPLVEFLIDLVEKTNA